jgi:hypothetical protein
MDAGKIREGLAALEEALEDSRSTSMHHYDAEIYRLKGELLLRQIRSGADALYLGFVDVEEAF